MPVAVTVEDDRNSEQPPERQRSEEERLEVKRPIEQITSEPKGPSASE